METRHGNLVVKRNGNDLEIGNDLIRARFVMRDGGYSQEFLAAGRDGSFRLLLSSLYKNLIPMSEHRMCTSPMIAGERPHLFGVCRESLRMVYSKIEVTRHDEDCVGVKLSGTVQGHSLVCEITIERGASRVHIVARDTIERGSSDPLVEYLMSSYAFVPDGKELAVGEALDYAWAPNLRPGDDQLIGDEAFHSPAVVVQKGHLAAALVVDLDSLAESRAMPCSLDLDLRNGLLYAPLISYGFCGYERTRDGRCFQHDITMARRLPVTRLTYAYDLLLCADCKPLSAYRQAARFLWDRYGQSLPHARRVAMPGTQTEIGTITPDAQAALGLHYQGFGKGDRNVQAAAVEMKDAVLSAPMSAGLFATRFDPERAEWRGCASTTVEACYSTFECTSQLRWLLWWHRRVQADPRIVKRARECADFLISTRLRSGAVPAWYGPDLQPLASLRSSAATAASALFLAELAHVTGLARYARAAEHSAKFVLSQVLPAHAFADHITLASPGDAFPNNPDPHSGARPHGGWALLWTARMCLGLFGLTGRRNYLERGLEVLDQLCLLQSVGARPWMGPNEKPGMLVGSNTGSTWNAELTAEFARCAMDFGAVTGEREYFERGAVALSVALAEPADASSRARVGASAALARKNHGLVYVHMGRKWAASVAGPPVTRVEFTPGTVQVDIDVSSNGFRSGRVVFAGMRGRGYKVRVNGWSGSASRADMMSGLPLEFPRHAPPEAAQQGQLTLEAM